MRFSAACGGTPGRPACRSCQKLDADPMTPRRLLLGTTAILLSLTVIVRADDIVLSRFGDYLDALRTQAGIPGLAAAIVGPADVAWEHTFGVQDVARNVAALPITSFHLDGVTQVVVASLLMRCADSGWISLDGRVGAYAPGGPG